MFLYYLNILERVVFLIALSSAVFVIRFSREETHSFSTAMANI